MCAIYFHISIYFQQLYYKNNLHLTNVNHVGEKNELPSNQGNAKYFSVTL